MQNPFRRYYSDMRDTPAPKPPTPPRYVPPSDPLLVYDPARPPVRTFVGLRQCFCLDAEYDEEL